MRIGANHANNDLQQPQMLSLRVHFKADLPILWIKGFIYIPSDDGSSVLRVIEARRVSVGEPLEFTKIEYGKGIEFQIMGVNGGNKILAGIRGYPSELIAFALQGGVQLNP